MKLREVQNKYRLPVTSEKDMLKICNKLNIPATNLDYDLSESQVERILYSKDIHVLDVSAKTTKMHKDFIDNYTKLQQKYDELSKRMATKSYLAEDRKVIIALGNGLKQAKGEYEAAIKNVEENTLSPLRRGVVGFYDDKIEKQDNKLAEKYKELDRLDELGSQYKSKFKKKRNYSKMAKVQKKINKLREKQGKLETKQTKILNKGTEKYINKKAVEHDAYLSNLQREMEYVENRIENRNKRSDYRSDIITSKKELNDLKNKKGIKAAVNRFHLKSDIRQLEKRIKDLKKKEGRCVMANQYSRSISVTYQTTR
ncbi:MAG: hypothetical protein GX758_01095 [Tenericutes bacterium]|nr:hypothetical protein [Mycoplasmatota bacterium]